MSVGAGCMAARCCIARSPDAGVMPGGNESRQALGNQTAGAAGTGTKAGLPPYAAGRWSRRRTRLLGPSEALASVSVFTPRAVAPNRRAVLFVLFVSSVGRCLRPAWLRCACLPARGFAALR